MLLLARYARSAANTDILKQLKRSLVENVGQNKLSAANLRPLTKSGWQPKAYFNLNFNTENVLIILICLNLVPHLFLIIILTIQQIFLIRRGI